MHMKREMGSLMMMEMVPDGMMVIYKQKKNMKTPLILRIILKTGMMKRILMRKKI